MRAGAIGGGGAGLTHSCLSERTLPPAPPGYQHSAHLSLTHPPKKEGPWPDATVVKARTHLYKHTSTEGDTKTGGTHHNLLSSLAALTSHPDAEVPLYLQQGVPLRLAEGLPLRLDALLAPRPSLHNTGSPPSLPSSSSWGHASCSPGELRPLARSPVLASKYNACDGPPLAR